MTSGVSEELVGVGPVNGKDLASLQEAGDDTMVNPMTSDIEARLAKSPSKPKLYGL